MVLSAFPGKIPVIGKIFLIFYSSPNVAPKPFDQSCSNSIFRAHMQLSPARPFHFQPTLKIKGSSHKKQENKLSDKHDQLLVLLLCH